MLCEELKASRLSFWDCSLNEKWKEENSEDGFIITEAKSENTIDRITSLTTGGGVRQTERVPAGAEFDFKLMLRQFEGDKPELLELVLKGLKLLELDSLGGSGSRGYGKVKFTKLTVDGNARRLDDIKPFKSGGFMKLYRFTLYPKSAMGTPLVGDTLFGQLFGYASSSGNRFDCWWSSYAG